MFRMRQRLRYMLRQRAESGRRKGQRNRGDIMNAFSSIRLRAAAFAAALSLAVTGCFVAPGKFTAELALTGADQFTFTYDGEIFFLGLSGLSQMGGAQDPSFTPECFDEETYETRECSKAETAEQRKEWDARAVERAAENKRQAEQMATMMGGINPSDPKAADELVNLLMRHKGWEQVESLGDGLFKVSYAINGTLGHDFMFPLIEGFPATNPFVQTFARKNGQARITAPGFAAQGSDGMMGAMMGGIGPLAAFGGMGDQGSAGEQMPKLPVLEGIFTIRTTGPMTIRANNTDDGPEATTTGEVLTWKISPRTNQGPTALINLAR